MFSGRCFRSLGLMSSFFFNATATTEIYTLSLHDALPISGTVTERPDFLLNLVQQKLESPRRASALSCPTSVNLIDRKSTRLNSSHTVISYAVFCLKKKKIYIHNNRL